MYFLLSGEGATDLGVGEGAGEISESDHFKPGPLAFILAAIVKHHHGLTPEEGGGWGFVRKSMLEMEHAAESKGGRVFHGPSKKRRGKGMETGYYFRNACALARIAAKKRTEVPDVVVAVLFRDSDGTCSVGRGDWESKRQSMLDGFAHEGLETGVPMIPKPKSEAWLLCALKHHQHGCGPLEERSGNDRSSNSLKNELARLLSNLDRAATREDLCAMVEDGSIDWRNVKTPSFHAFLDRLVEAIGAGPPVRDSAEDR